MFGEITLDLVSVRWIGDVVVAISFIRRADGCEPLEIGARGVVEPHGRLPGLKLRDCTRQMQECVVLARARSVSRRSMRYQFSGPRRFFRGGDADVEHLAV